MSHSKFHFNFSCNAVIYIVLSFLFFSITAFSVPKEEYQIKQSQEIVRSLFKDRLYFEAISFLEFKLETASDKQNLVPLKLLLVDAYLALEDTENAKNILAELQSEGVDFSYQKSIEQKIARLAEIKDLFELRQMGSSEKVEVFRVQIYITENQQNAIEVSDKANSEFPAYNTSVKYRAPNYTVNIGDFQERLEAVEVRNQAVRKGYTEALVINDSIVIQREPEVVSSAEEMIEPVIVPEGIPEEGRPLITNSYFEMDIRMILSDLSMETGIPILWDGTVIGLVTYEAADQHLDELLKAILSPLGYTYSYIDGAYFVGSMSPGEVAFGLLSETEVVYLSNIDADAAIRLLSVYYEPYVKANNANNMVCITAPKSITQRIKKDLGLIDQPPYQIMIEVMITEIATSALRELGLDWTITPNEKESGIWDIGTSHTDLETPAVIGNYADTGIKIGGNYIDLIASLEAMTESGDAKIRANPRITTMNGRTAKIGITREEYFIIQTGSQTYAYNTIQSVSSGISLEIRPLIDKSGVVTMYVNPEVGDVVGEGSGGLPVINKRSAITSVRVKDGETFTIGGLSLQQTSNTERKVPLLGDIPLLGYLFKYTKVEKKDTEIIIFITPHILGK